MDIMCCILDLNIVTYSDIFLYHVISEKIIGYFSLNRVFRKRVKKFRVYYVILYTLAEKY